MGYRNIMSKNIVKGILLNDRRINPCTMITTSNVLRCGQIPTYYDKTIT